MLAPLMAAGLGEQHAVAGIGAAGSSATRVLYDGAAGTLPDAQGWTFLDASFGGASRSLNGGAALLDTLAANQIHAGYSASAAGYLGSTSPVPVLNRTTSYTVTFAIQVEQEDHSSPSADKNGDGIADRAGFSVTVIGGDKRGVELGFWQNQVWAQDDGAQEPPAGTLFTHAEGAALDTTIARSYTLAIARDSYRLASGGRPVLSGRLRDYTAFDSRGLPNPYQTPSFLFFGDGTAAARARIRLSYIAVTVAGTAPVYVPLVARG